MARGRAGLLGSLVLILAGALVAVAAASGRDDPSPDDRLRRLREDLERMRQELLALERREAGVLGELERADARLRLLEGELQETALRLESIRSAIAHREERLSRLEREQGRRRAFLRERVRALYKAGPFDSAAALFGSGGRREALSAVQRAVHATERDLGVLTAWRLDRERLAAELEALSGDRDTLVRTTEEEHAARSRLARQRAEREQALLRIRADRKRREEAVVELEEAARELGRIVEGASPAGTSPPALDVRAFRGLLDWPVSGRVAAGFGNAVHPRFKTVVPHPGLDLETVEGATFRAVFDGRIAYAAPLRGYGLTVLVDHGRGVVSVYANASALVVAPDQVVVRGQVLGRVGDAASRGSAGIYFEMREEGRPVDPSSWLSAR